MTIFYMLKCMLNRNMEDIKNTLIKLLQVKTTMSENTLNGVNGSLEIAKECISKFVNFKT